MTAEHEQVEGGMPDVRVFFVRVADVRALYRALVVILSPAEQARAELYVREETREEFVVGRACLRLLLAERLGVAARDVPLQIGEFGKPFVPADEHFNVSHSEGVIAIALGGMCVGIDLEFMRPTDDCLEVGRSVFSPQDMSELEGVEAELRTTLFYRMWTRYESAAKCVGSGLSLSFENGAEALTLQEVNCLPGFACCVATERKAQLERGLCLRLHDLQGLMTSGRRGPVAVKEHA